MQFRGLEQEGLEREHPELTDLATLGLGRLTSLRGSLQPGPDGATWVQHLDYADRAGRLADHLHEAIGATRNRHFETAFAIARVALEHVQLDRLLLLAETYRIRLGKLTEDEYDELRGQRDEGTSADIVDVQRARSGNVTLVLHGHAVNDAEGARIETISPYYWWLKRHNSILGPPHIQDRFDDGLLDVSERQRIASDHQILYRNELGWTAIRDNLELNQIADEDESFRLDVHYRFLSAFCHPTNWGYQQIANHRGRPPHQARGGDHVLSELVLLYALSFIDTLLDAWLKFDAQRSILAADARAGIESDIAAIRTTTHYFWYPPSPPTDWDRVGESNRRHFRTFRDGATRASAGVDDPRSIDADDVQYYSDPLDRLARMHFGFTELTTGLSATPPW